MKRNFILLYLLLASLIWSQSGALSWSIYQVVITQQSPTPPFTSFIFRNVGQTVHEVVLEMFNTPGNVCPGTVGINPTNAVPTGLQFSYDGINYVSFGSQVQLVSQNLNPNNPASILFVGTGAYPRVRFFIGNYDSARCSLTINYSGATTTPYTQILGASASGSAATGPPVVIGGVGNQGLVAPFVTCDFTTAGQAPVGTTAIFTAIQPTQTVKICGVVLSPTSTNDGATIIAGTTTTNPCDTSTATLLPVTWGAQQLPMTYGNGTGVVLNAFKGANVCMTVANAPMNYSFSYAILQ